MDEYSCNFGCYAVGKIGNGNEETVEVPYMDDKLINNLHAMW